MVGDTKVLEPGTEAPNNGENRRDFMVLTASALAGIGGIVAMWPFVDSLNPSADVLALASIEVDISSIEPGQSIKVMWRGKPVFIRRRTPEEVEKEENVNLKELVDPEPDSARVKPGHKEWLITVGVCTHLGCVPLVNQGEYNGWFCPCHGSSYDVSGRIRKGPAPTNLVVPEYAFISDTVVRIG